MKISFILSSLWMSGGVYAVIEYANRLTAKEHRISLVIPGGAIEPRLQKQIAFGVELIESKTKMPSKRNPAHILRLAASLSAAIPKSDVIVATHTPTVIPALLAAKRQKMGRPVWLYMDYAEMFKTRPIEGFLLRHAPRWFDRVITISEAGRQDVRTNTSVEAEVVWLGLPHLEVLLAEPGNLDPETKQILYVGDSRPRKGLKDFLAAAEIVYQRFPQLKLAIVSKELLQVETEVPCGFYHFPSRRELGKLYRSSHLFVSASWAEGFGFPPLEAMACGTPVVLTNSRGVLDFARSGENCLIVPPHNPYALAKAMMQVLSDESLAARFRTNGVQTAKAFDWDVAVDQFEMVLIKMMKAY